MNKLPVIWRFILFPMIYFLFISAVVFFITYFGLEFVVAMEPDEGQSVYKVSLYGILIFNLLFFLWKPGLLKEHRFLKLFSFCFGWFLVFGLAVGIFSYFIKEGGNVNTGNGFLSRYELMVYMLLFCLLYYVIFCFIMTRLAPWYSRLIQKWKSAQRGA